ncbi:MAG: carboxylating nicotinate-nucleotide diphosphorylase [Bacteroidales bacterium]|nr:carboxylating nicotinate-nucleotide diphosphorylase [Bacteroidales bacterium]
MMEEMNNVHQIIMAALAEDIGNGDHSSLACIDPTIQGEMRLLVKADGIIAGIDVAREVLHCVDPNIRMEQYKNDGDMVHKGDIVFTLKGSSQKMLTAERTLLNFMQRMSGIATAAHRYAEVVNGTKTTILDTRKTTPNMRIFEKYAVKVGGCQNHRFGLFDMVMLKDNHIDFAGGIEQAIDKTKAYLAANQLDLKIEIETRNLAEVKRVMEHGGVNRIMLDNFKPEQIIEALKVIDGKYETEASGNITMDNLREYAETGVDFISVGALTHHIASLDLSLKVIK